jgi:hypothetical protein
MRTQIRAGLIPSPNIHACIRNAFMLGLGLRTRGFPAASKETGGSISALHLGTATCFVGVWTRESKRDAGEV